MVVTLVIVVLVLINTLCVAAEFSAVSAYPSRSEARLSATYVLLAAQIVVSLRRLT